MDHIPTFKSLLLGGALLACCTLSANPQPLHLLYTEPALDSVVGWEWESLPLGNAHFGVSVFGVVTNERLQVTHNAFLTKNNLTDALDLRVAFPHEEHPANYRRSLDLDRALADVTYVSRGVTYRREYFTSHPAGVLAAKFTASEKGALAFVLSAETPFLRPFGDQEGRGRTASVTADGNTIDIVQELEYHGVKFFGRLVVETDGEVKSVGNRLAVADATEAVVYFACDCNYRLSTAAFVTHRADPDLDPRPGVVRRVAAALAKGYDALKAEHEHDYRALYSRVTLDLGGSAADAATPTYELLKGYKAGRRSAYLEEVYFQYGRYLLIASSRPGSLPANLQGIWSACEKSPWGSGYWHNINVQMNYWPCFAGDLMECFEPYAEFNAAFRPATRAGVLDFLKLYVPENVPADGEASDLWTVGTSSYPYEVESASCYGHSGPGTGGMTTKLFFDWYDFTRDREVLDRHAYPALRGMTEFLSRCVRDYDGSLLSVYSASPEQETGKHIWKGRSLYYHTVGCAFDQQMIRENNADFLALKAARGETAADPLADRVRAQLDRYDSVLIGRSGQIKEYREEGYYDSTLCEWRHRHISQLIGLTPGLSINRDTTAWADAAKVTLSNRTDESTGWALAHRLNAWARLGDGDHAYRLLNNLLKDRTYPNLWDAHPPFQIDGNFGAAAGMMEMLLQSRSDGTIDLLPALPSSWPRGAFHGLRARGAFRVSCEWADGALVRATVVSLKGLKPVVRFEGRVLSPESVNGDIYTFASAPRVPRAPQPSALKLDRATKTLSWTPPVGAAVRYNVYRNRGNRPVYECVARDLEATRFVDPDWNPQGDYYVTYKVSAHFPDGTGEGEGPYHTWTNASREEKQIYAHQMWYQWFEFKPEDLD